jgi:hypothetical protein
MWSIQLHQIDGEDLKQYELIYFFKTYASEI